MSDRIIDVTVPGNGYVLTNPKLSPLQYWKGQDLDLRKLPLKLAQQMAANPACRWLQAEPPVVKKADAPSLGSRKREACEDKS